MRDQNRQLMWAARLGAAFADPDLFVDCINECPDRDLAMRMMKLGARLSSQGGSKRREYVLNHVLECEARTSFFLQAPLDDLLLEIASCACKFDDSTLLFLLNRILDHGGERVAARMACALSPCIIAAVPTTPLLAELVDLATRLMQSDLSLVAHMFADAAFLDELSKRREFVTILPKLSSFPIEQCSTFLTVTTIGKLVDRCFSFARPVYFGQSFSQCAIRFLARCAAAHVADLEETITRGMVFLGRSGWAVEYGDILVSLLDTSSIKLVVELYRLGCLDDLVRTAISRHADHRTWWNILNQLRRQWPERVSNLLGEPTPHVAVTPESCPITLVECAHPVTASDGHTYERSAIMKHICVNGSFSPMTKQPLEMFLFPNRCICTGQVHLE